MISGSDMKNLIDPAAAEQLIAAHDGDVALLYIHAMKNGALDPDSAARDLCRTMSEIKAAEEKLRRMNILPDAAPKAQEPHKVLPPADEPPEYRAEDIIASKGDPVFAAIIQEAQKVFGHALSSADLKHLFGIYDYLALPAEVIYILLHHCGEISKGRRLSMRFVEKEAYSWVNREIYTLEQADEYITRYRSRREATGRIAEMLGIRGRDLTGTESKHIGGWLDMGFEESTINEAFERTVLNTGKLTWNYMNRILQSWHDGGIHTLEEVEKRDPRRKNSTPPPAVKPRGGSSIDLEGFMSTISKI